MTTWLNNGAMRPSQARKGSYRPRLDVLEDRLALSTVALDYDDGGLWRYTDYAGWQQLAFADPDAVAASADGSVAANFGGDLWRFTDRFGWQLLHTVAPSQLGVSDSGTVWADFDWAGLWRFDDFSGWLQVTPADPLLMDVAADGSLVADFSNGLWRLTPWWGWQLLTTWETFQVDINVGGNVVADLGGLFRFTDFAGWELLDWGATSYIGIGPDAGVVGDFEDALYYYSDVWGWYLLTDTPIYDLGFSADGWAVFAFDGGPVARYNETFGWQTLDWTPPAQIAVG